MGVVETIGIDSFPLQSELIGSNVRVCFRYNTTDTIIGQIVRDDREPPWETLIYLEDGRIVRAVECQYSHA